MRLYVQSGSTPGPGTGPVLNRGIKSRGAALTSRPPVSSKKHVGHLPAIAPVAVASGLSGFGGIHGRSPGLESSVSGCSISHDLSTISRIPMSCTFRHLSSMFRNFLPCGGGGGGGGGSGGGGGGDTYVACSGTSCPAFVWVVVFVCVSGRLVVFVWVGGWVGVGTCMCVAGGGVMSRAAPTVEPNAHPPTHLRLRDKQIRRMPLRARAGACVRVCVSVCVCVRV